MLVKMKRALRPLMLICVISGMVASSFSGQGNVQPLNASMCLDDDRLKECYQLARGGSTTAAMALHSHYALGVLDAETAESWVRYAVKLGSPDAKLTSASYLIIDSGTADYESARALYFEARRDLEAQYGAAMPEKMRVKLDSYREMFERHRVSEGNVR